MQQTAFWKRNQNSAKSLLTITLLFIFLLTSNGSFAADLRFVNNTSTSVEIFFVLNDIEDYYTTLAPDEEYVQQLTFPGHTWRIKRGTENVGEYEVTAAEQQEYIIVDVNDNTSSSTITAEQNEDKSLQLGPATPFKAINETNEKIDVFWINFEGQEEPAKPIAAGASRVFNTFQGHLWRFKSRGETISTYRVTQEPNQSIQLSHNQDGAQAKSTLTEDRSVELGGAVQLIAVNGTPDDLDTYWVDHKGQEKPAKPINYGESRRLNTFAGHLWRFKYGDTTIGTYRVTKDPKQYIQINPDKGDSAVSNELPGAGAYRRWVSIDQPRIYESPPDSPSPWIEGFKGQTLDINSLVRRGYHYFRTNPMDLTDNGLGARAPSILRQLIMDTKQYSIEAGYMVPHEFLFTREVKTRATKTTNIFFSETERTRSWAVNASADVSAGGKTGPESGLGAAFNRSEEKSVFSSTERVSIMASRWGSSFWISLNRRNIVLNPIFKQEFLKLGDDYDAYKTFFNTFGTHFSQNTLFGGMAFYEEYTTNEEIGKSIARAMSVSANGKAPIKSAQVAGEVGFETSDTSRMSQKQTKGEAIYRSYGGNSGSNFDEWMLAESETKSLVPIKVDLRPLYAIIHPQTLEAKTFEEAERILDIKRKFKSNYERYMAEESKKLNSYASRKPRVFAVRIDSINLTQDDDDGGNGPDLFGYINITAVKKDTQILNNRVWGEWNREKTTEWNIDNATPRPTPIGEFYNVTKTEFYIHVSPTVVYTQRGSKTIETLDYELDEYSFRPYGYLRDEDYGSDSADDWLWIDDISSAIRLNDVVAERGFKSSATFAKANNLGSVSVNFSIREVGVNLQTQNMALPNFPKF